MADKDVVLNNDAFTDESVAGNFAVASDESAFLDFNERADLRALANLTTIKIDEVVDDDIAAELDVRSDYAELFGHESRGLGNRFLNQESQTAKCTMHA